MRSIIIIAGILLVASMSVRYANSDESADDDGQSEEKSAEAFLKSNAAALEYATPTSNEESYLPDIDCSLLTDKVTGELCWNAYRAYFDYYESGFEHRKKVFAWQHLSTRIIFVVVLLLVAVGVYFAWVQFRVDMQRDAAQASADPTEMTNLEISTSGIKVSSRVLGVIILALSLAFFYLYLAFVFPIREIL